MPIAYKFRAYPTASQARALGEQLAEAARFYNAALQERREAWRLSRQRVTFAAQCKQLAQIRSTGDIAIPSYEIACEVLHRVQHAFTGFFGRVKAGRAGYPRFRPASRYDSLTTLHPGSGIGLSVQGLRVSGVGIVKVKQHREIRGRVVALSIKRVGHRWFAIAVAQAETAPLPATSRSVGVDVGLSAFASMSDGVQVAAPRFLRRSESALRRANRHLSRCQRSSRRRLKAIALRRAIHTRISARRLDFTHKLSRAIVNGNDLIAVERLRIANMVRSRSFAKSIHDAGWRLFLNQLAYKAANAGRVFVEVDASGTSQTCLCGAEVRKTLKDRWHSCQACGLSGPRDVVSAMVIEARGRRVQALTGPVGSVVCGAEQ